MALEGVSIGVKVLQGFLKGTGGSVQGIYKGLRLWKVGTWFENPGSLLEFLIRLMI